MPRKARNEMDEVTILKQAIGYARACLAEAERLHSDASALDYWRCRIKALEGQLAAEVSRARR